MTTKDPTVRIAWFRGQAYPISNAPIGQAPSNTWYVFADGRWHELFEQTPKELDSAAWRALEERVIQWLEARGSSRT